MNYGKKHRGSFFKMTVRLPKNMEEIDNYKSCYCCSSAIKKDVKLLNKKMSPGCSKSSKLAPLDNFAAKYMIDGSQSSDSTMKKLIEIISDPITKESERWIGRLLRNFLHEVGEDGFIFRATQKIEELTSIMRMLEFLAQRSQDSQEYEIYLEKMLELCKLPPLLTKSSDCLRCRVVLEKYFSTLGYLAIILSTDREILKVFDVLFSLLVRIKPLSVTSVKLQLCHAAMKNSQLSKFVTKLSEISSPKIYDRVLELILLLATISTDCCYGMLEAGILNHLFMRMNQSETVEAPPVVSDEDDDIVRAKDNVVLTTNIMWALVRSIFPSKDSPSIFDKVPVPSIEATRSLRNAFRHQVCHSQGNIESRILRNDLVSLILASSVAIPSWDMVRCGLAEDLVVLSIIDGSGIKGTWTENISFDTSNENLIFKKIMLTALYHLSNHGAAISVMAKRKVMPTILDMINPEVERNKRWSLAQLAYISRFAMRTLARLANRMPGEFVRNQGSSKLIMMAEQSLLVKFDLQMTMEFTRTVCSIVAPKCPPILADFRKEEATSTFVKLIDRILTFDHLTMQHQRILTLLIIVVEAIMTEEENSDRCYENASLDTATKLLRRCVNWEKEDFPLDQRLLVSVGSCIWECILHFPYTGEKFVDDGGIYMILDIIEKSCFPVRCIYLGLLTDISNCRYGAPHLCTWRGTDKTVGFVTLLAKCFREEEIRSGVKRTAEGCIEDVELPLMGTEQLINTFRTRATHDCSPALASMFGSVAPKIYSLRKIMISEADSFEKSREHYKILLNDPPVEDRITMHIADHYYRFIQGQLWFEVSRYLEQIGVNILGMDGEIMLLMNQRHREWGMYVRGLQDKILKAERRKEIGIERSEVAKIRDSRLGPALNALREIDYIRRTTEHTYTLTKKISQCNWVNKALKFPAHSDEEHCHRTFNDNWNITTILEHNHTIRSVPVKSTENSDLVPVSPASSTFGIDSTIELRISESKLSSIESPTCIVRKKLSKHRVGKKPQI